MAVTLLLAERGGDVGVPKGCPMIHSAPRRLEIKSRSRKEANSRAEGTGKRSERAGPNLTEKEPAGVPHQPVALSGGA